MNKLPFDDYQWVVEHPTLKERPDAQKSYITELLRLNCHVLNTLLPKIIEISSTHKLDCVKMVKADLAVGLKEAKDIVELIDYEVKENGFVLHDELRLHDPLWLANHPVILPLLPEYANNTIDVIMRNASKLLEIAAKDKKIDGRKVIRTILDTIECTPMQAATIYKVLFYEPPVDDCHEVEVAVEEVAPVAAMVYPKEPTEFSYKVELRMSADIETVVVFTTKSVFGPAHFARHIYDLFRDTLRIVVTNEPQG